MTFLRTPDDFHLCSLKRRFDETVLVQFFFGASDKIRNFKCWVTVVMTNDHLFWFFYNFAAHSGVFESISDKFLLCALHKSQFIWGDNTHKCLVRCASLYFRCSENSLSKLMCILQLLLQWWHLSEYLVPSLDLRSPKG